MTIEIPTTIYRVYNHPLLFSPDHLKADVENASDLDLAAVPLLDLDGSETTKVDLHLGKPFLVKYREVAKRRGCSTEALINSALVEWMNNWYRGGRPKSFPEICKNIAIDVFMNSDDGDLLYFYFLGLFGPPSTLGDDNYWFEPPFPEWQEELLATYEQY